MVTCGNKKDLGSKIFQNFYKEIVTCGNKKDSGSKIFQNFYKEMVMALEKVVTNI